MGFTGLSQFKMQYPGGQWGGGFDNSRMLKGGITGTEIMPGFQGKSLTPRTGNGPVYPSGQSPNAGKEYQPYDQGGYPGPRGPQGPAGPPGLDGKPGQSFGGQEWVYGAPAVPVGNLANIGIPLEDQIAIQSVGTKIKQFGGGYEYSPTKPGVVYSSQNGPYDQSGVPITTGYPGLGMSGVVAKSTGITGSPAYAAPAQTRPGEQRLPGQPTEEERQLALTGRSPYQGYAQLATAPQVSDVLSAPPAVAAPGSPQAPVNTVPGRNTKASGAASLIDAFRSVSGGFFQKSTGRGGGAKQTFLGGGGSGILSPSNPTGGFFGVSGTQNNRRGRSSLLG